MTEIAQKDVKKRVKLNPRMMREKEKNEERRRRWGAISRERTRPVVLVIRAKITSRSVRFSRFGREKEGKRPNLF